MPKLKGFLRLTPEEQLAELEDELKRGRAYEASLRSEKWVMHGLQEGEAIYVDPRAAIIETVLHELIHRRQPRLSERTVDITAKRLLANLDEAGKWKWWKAWERTKKRIKPKDVED
jgi:hypothetical protein